VAGLRIEGELARALGEVVHERGDEDLRATETVGTVLVRAIALTGCSFLSRCLAFGDRRGRIQRANHQQISPSPRPRLRRGKQAEEPSGAPSAPHSVVTSYWGQPGPGDGWSIRSATGGDCSGT
jgi:hypothetical protein